MPTNNRICQLFGIELPIIAGGMVWCSGWRLAAAVSEQGGLGLIGAGSMHPETLIEHIHKLRQATKKPWGVNIPLIYPEIDRLIQIVIDEHVPIVFTSAGSPKKYTARLHEHGIKVAHVVSSSLFAMKCEAAGVDAIVAEGFEAGGHNGREETATMVLLPQVRRATTLPLIAAGGIGCGEAMLAVQALGAEGVQIGSLFAVSRESSASEEFKRACCDAKEGDTMLCLKKISPTRLLRNQLFERISEAENGGASADELRQILGTAAAKRGIFCGDTEGGEMEIGQVVGSINEIRSVEEIMSQLLSEYHAAVERMAQSPMME